MFRFGLLFVLISVLGCSGKSSGSIVVSGEKLQIRLLNKEVPAGTYISFDDITIRHELPDSSNTANAFDHNCINVRKVKDRVYAISPSRSILPLYDKWVPCKNSRGVIANGWIKCFAYLKNLDGIEDFSFKMDSYLVHEGILIVERLDEKELTLEYSMNLPVDVKILE